MQKNNKLKYYFLINTDNNQRLSQGLSALDKFDYESLVQHVCTEIRVVAVLKDESSLINV